MWHLHTFASFCLKSADYASWADLTFLGLAAAALFESVTRLQTFACAFNFTFVWLFKFSLPNRSLVSATFFFYLLKKTQKQILLVYIHQEAVLLFCFVFNNCTFFFLCKVFPQGMWLGCVQMFSEYFWLPMLIIFILTLIYCSVEWM